MVVIFCKSQSLNLEKKIKILSDDYYLPSTHLPIIIPVFWPSHKLSSSLI